LDPGDGDWDARRRQKIAAARAKRRRLLAYSLVALVLVVAVAAGAWALSRSAPGPVKPARPATNAVSPYNSTAVSIDMSSLSTNATFYKYESGKTIRFFAVLGSDGQIRTAFDNAYCCYRRDLGERQEGQNMVCNWCQKSFPIDELNQTNLDPLTVGRCSPAHLRNTVVDERLVIEKSDLEAGSYLFK